MNNILKIALIFFAFSTFMSCKKDNSQDGKGLLEEFVSLEATSTIVIAGETIEITAIVKGEDIAFSWTATAGDIIGSGSKITYVPHACSMGQQTISCTAKGTNREETKSIEISVE